MSEFSVNGHWYFLRPIVRRKIKKTNIFVTDSYRAAVYRVCSEYKVMFRTILLLFLLSYYNDDSLSILLRIDSNKPNMIRSWTNSLRLVLILLRESRVLLRITSAWRWYRIQLVVIVMAGEISTYGHHSKN